MTNKTILKVSTERTVRPIHYTLELLGIPKVTFEEYVITVDPSQYSICLTLDRSLHYLKHAVTELEFKHLARLVEEHPLGLLKQLSDLKTPLYIESYTLTLRPYYDEYSGELLETRLELDLIRNGD